MFTNLKKGDAVNRNMGRGGPTMPMVVMKIADGVIYAAATQDGKVYDLGWTFDQKTGAEIDDTMRWGPAYEVTGTYLVSIEAQPEQKNG